MNGANDMTQVIPQAADYVRILPEIVLAIFGMIVMVLDPFIDERRNQTTLGIIALVGSLAALVATLFQSQYPGLGFWNMVQVDSFSVFFHFLVAAITVVVILTSFEYMQVQGIRAGEYYALVLFSAVGMSLMSSAVELVLIFIALEISSIATYILAGFRLRAAISSESSLKYFLLGSFATAFFLYGVALMFGATGSTSIPTIADALHSLDIPLLAYLGVAFMFVGLGFKVAAAPFHVWTPDVYEGAPAPVVGFMSTAPKAAAFAVLLRVMFQADAPGRLWLIWVVAALSMTLGNIGALVQDNVKRLLAYSSIAQAGYMLIAFAALPNNGIAAVMFYTASYAAMNVGAFAVISHISGEGERYVTLEDYEGLGRRSPLSGGDPHDFSFVLDRHSDYRWFFRQVLCVQRRVAGQSGWTGDYWRAQQRRCFLLLPAAHRRDVYARSARGSAGITDSHRTRSGFGDQFGSNNLSRRSSRTAARLCRAHRG